LLLVDLSETVVSLHVTGKHDVLDVISMLLKPEGVMLENELYIDKMARHFDHTVHIFYGSPKVCVQVHTVSSNSVDFMTSPIHDHDIDMFLIDKVEEPSDRFKYIHDYIETDPIAQGKCKDHDDAIDLITTEYGRKAGILMVVEAEKCSKDLNDGASLEELILQVLESAGLSPLSSSAGARDDQSIQVVMKEGYVAARVWPELQYVGFDLHFWGAFSKMEGVRASLMEALDSQTTSSYRVVVGGMHGSSTWSQDEQEIGVQFSQKRNCTAPDVSSKKLNTNDAISVAIDESLDLLADAENVVVAVVCGPQEKEDDCLALQILKDHPQVDTIVPIFACQGIPDFNNGTFDYQPMYDCEKEIIERLESLNEDEDTTLDAFMIDLSAPLSMVQIFASIWAVPDHRDDWLEQPYIVAMPFLREDPKRKRFMDLFRKFGHGTVSTMAEVIFKGASAQDYLGWRVFTFDDQTAVHSISEMERSLQERLPETNIKVRLLEGGQRHTEADLMLEERSFRPEDYDYGPNQKQMSEQRSLGRQTVFQLERTFDDEVSMPSMVELVSGLKTTLASMGYETNAEPEQFSTVGDGAVVTSVFAQGSAVMVWDGLDHVDINLFCLNETHELADQFLKFFIESVDHRLERSLRDDMPRGIGRVVNFQSDMVARESLTAEIER
jgi:S-adenosylmethionine/arginine decarboxylase-like enzyme